MTVAGSGMGAADYSGGARVGATGCESSEWVSGTSVRCLASHGVATTQRVMITVGEKAGSVTETFSFGPGLSDRWINNYAATGAVGVTVIGELVSVAAYSVQVRVGGTAVESTVWQSSSSVIGLTSHGISATLRLALTASGEVGSMTEAVSFDAGGLSAVQPWNRASTGSQSVTLAGASLGLRAYSSQTRVGGTGCEATAWVSETVVVCAAYFGGLGTVRVSVTAGQRAGSLTEMASFDGPGVSSVLVGLLANRGSTGSTSVTLSGIGFGTVGTSASGKVGATGCESSEWTSSSSVRCLTAAGVRGTVRVGVTAGVRTGSVTELGSYDGPRASSALMRNGASTGSASVTVAGSGMGTADYSGGAR